MRSFSLKYYVSLTLLFVSGILTAQQDLTLYDMRSMPQAHMINPSKMPYARGYLLLPGVSGAYVSLNNTGFTYNDAFSLNANDSLDMHLDKAIDKMQDLNEIGFDLRNTLLGFGFRTGASYWSFNIDQKLSARIDYPKELFQFVWYGNASPQFLGKRVPLDGLGLDVQQYAEVSLGYARDINEDWSAGIKVKALSGIANFQTTQSKLGITTTEDNYALELDGQFAYRTGGAMAGILDSNTTIEEALQSAALGNLGFAFDLGATYRYNDRLSFNASVLDIGLINWSEGVSNASTNDVTYTYSGASLDEWLNNNNTEGLRTSLDSLIGQIEWQRDSTPYTTLLPIKTFLAANFQVLPKTEINALTYNEYYNGNIRSSLRVGMTQRVRNFLMASLNYSIYGRSAANIGAGLTVNAGPFQFYFVTDNALAFVLPTGVKNYHLRFGLNLTFANNFSLN